VINGFCYFTMLMGFAIALPILRIFRLSFVSALNLKVKPTLKAAMVALFE